MYLVRLEFSVITEIPGTIRRLARPESLQSRSMSIKSDKWIRRMAEEHGLISPFEPGQVRAVDGKK
eukprot:gene29212-51169_t